MSVSTSTRLRALALAAACAASLGLADTGGADHTTTTTESGGVSGDIREQFDAAVRQSLETAAANGAPIDVDCAVDKLQAALSDAEVQQIVEAFQSGQTPPSSIQQELSGVAIECVKQ